jgi:ribosome-binding factor A
MTHRVQRVRELIRRELGTILERHFSFSGCLVTIQDVDLPADMKQCFIYVSVLGDGEPHDDIIKRLNDSRGLIQRDLFKRVILKNSPTLYFRLTDAVERGVRVLSIIESLPEIPDEPTDAGHDDGHGAEGEKAH